MPTADGTTPHAAPVRDLFLLREADLRAIEAAWQRCVGDWDVHWLGAPATGPRWTVQPAESQQALQPLDWQPAQHGAGQIWVCRAANFEAALASMLIGRSSGAPLPEHDWSRLAAQSAWNDLCERLAPFSLAPAAGYADAAYMRADPADVAACFAPLSGAIVLHDQRLGVNWLLSRLAYEHVLERAAPVTQVAAAPLAGLLSSIGAERVSLSLGLGDVEVALDDLRHLEAGDVVGFQASIHQPLILSAMNDDADRAQLHCRLGRQGERVAVQLVAPGSSQ